ncbi:hypothetical protein EV702DRAFT_1147761 [Suillus placidus]|uniref:CID domain-containing protein n=1 Tax=Suillus placidus TaxID=48579 RepID=A0A9P6ZIJ6_9AGAM|nr:hypothetical protein EV702DRAFT_1147761 [Suillus placidus]
MTHLEDFENTLKDVVNAKRLSASKMAKLTDIALKSVEHDTKLVAILYRTHKSLSSTAKVSSLYAFDALARAARSYATKRGITGDIHLSTGNAATFLLKVEGVLDGLFQDMVALDNAEAKEKTKKVLDIWTKSNTFPSPVLARLREMVDSRKESVKNPTPPVARVETQALPIITTPPSATPSQGPTPPLPESVQSTLLALLGQAAQAAGQPRIQTPPNTVSAPPLAGHLALLQQLAFTTNVPNGAPPSQSAIQLPLRNTQLPSAPQRPPPSLNNQPQPYYFSQSHAHHDPGRDSWQSRSSQSDHRRERDGFHDSNSRGFQRGFRGRGRGRGRWDDRDHDRFKDRDWNFSSRPRNSRSQSPRRSSGQQLRPHSPPQRPAASRDVAQSQTSAKLPEAGKDEFGRDIRPSSATPPRAASVDIQPQPPMIPSVVPARTAAPENRVPVSDQLPSVAASTSTQKVEPRKPSSAQALQQPGLDQFDITTFDFTAPPSWEALGKMWHSTYGDIPSQEELMQFITNGGVVAFTGQTNAVQAAQWQDPSWGAQTAGSGRGWQEDRGGDRGLMAGRGDTFGHGKYRDGGHWDEDAQHSDAIVLGEAGGQDSGHGEEQACIDLAQMGRDDLLNVDPDDSQNVGLGRMQ